ncbi:MAG TPA: tetratricopeptide repeat protein [Leptolyngbyaceae cyanobacterium]
MTAEPIELARTEFANGQIAFERGRYRESIEHFEKAVEMARPTTELGGEIQTWLVNAYSAVGRHPDAIALCQVLTRHPSLDIRKQAKNLLYILQAPSLQRREEWITKIPDLASLSDEGGSNAGTYVYTGPPKSTRRKKQEEDEEPLDLSKVNTRDNAFLWLALGAIALVLIGIASLY